MFLLPKINLIGNTGHVLEKIPDSIFLIPYYKIFFREIDIVKILGDPGNWFLAREKIFKQRKIRDFFPGNKKKISMLTPLPNGRIPICPTLPIYPWVGGSITPIL